MNEYCIDCDVKLEPTNHYGPVRRCYSCTQKYMDKMVRGTVSIPSAQDAAKAMGITFTGTPRTTGAISWTGPAPKTWTAGLCVNCGKIMKVQDGVTRCASCAATQSSRSPSKEPAPAATTISSGSAEQRPSQRFTTSDLSSGLVQPGAQGFVNIPASIFIMLMRAVGGRLDISDLDLIQEPNVNLKTYRLESPPSYVIEIEEKE